MLHLPGRRLKYFVSARLTRASAIRVRAGVTPGVTEITAASRSAIPVSGTPHRIERMGGLLGHHCTVKLLIVKVALPPLR